MRVNSELFSTAHAQLQLNLVTNSGHQDKLAYPAAVSADTPSIGKGVRGSVVG
jgi:hypothetical protein